MYLHIIGLPGTTSAASVTPMSRRRDLGRLSPCVCNTLRMAARAVTQLYDDVLRPSGLRVTQFSIIVAADDGGRSSSSDAATNAAAIREAFQRGSASCR